VTTDTPAAPQTAVPLRVRIEAATAWRPEAGDILDGHLVTVTRRETEYGAYPCLIIDSGHDESFHAFHAFHTIAKDKLKELKPSPGERIVIAYPGKQASKKRKDANGDPVEYNPYIIYCPDRDDEAPTSYDWDTDGEEVGF
jgi:hypothetical protein